MDHNPQSWGHPRNDIYGSYDPSYFSRAGQPQTHTQSPAVTGSSVLGVKFDQGIVIAADNLGSYGSLQRYQDVKRLRPFASNTVVGFGGDVSDMQHLDRMLQALDIRESYGGENRLNAKHVHTYLSKVMYKRRSDFNPLWNVLLVAGFDDDACPFLAVADLLGTTFSAPSLATGYGAHIAQPLLRRLFPEDEASVSQVKEEQAVEAVKECMKVLWYRDSRSLDTYSIAVISPRGVELDEAVKIAGQEWAFAQHIDGYGNSRFSETGAS